MNHFALLPRSTDSIPPRCKKNTNHYGMHGGQHRNAGKMCQEFDLLQGDAMYGSVCLELISQVISVNAHDRNVIYSQNTRSNFGRKNRINVTNTCHSVIYRTRSDCAYFYRLTPDLELRLFHWCAGRYQI